MTQELAQEIVTRTMSIIGRNINVMNEKGMIIGSGDRDRLYQVHDAALLVIQNRERMEIDEEAAEKLSGVKPGINLPILFNGEIVGVVGITGPPSEVSNYGELLKMAAEMMLQQAYLMEQIQWDKRLKQEIVNELLNEEAISDRLFLERANRMGIDLEVPRVALVIELKPHKSETETPGQLHAKVVSLIESKLEKADLLTSSSAFEIVVLKTIPLKNQEWDTSATDQQITQLLGSLKQVKGVSSKIGLGMYFPSAKGISMSYRSAKETLDTGKILYPEREKYTYSEMTFPVLVSRLHRGDHNRELLRPYELIVETDTTRELQETLKVFIEESGELNHTAEKLFIHRNTLRYRLQVIKNITGKDPKNTKDLLELYVSMLLYRLLK